VQYYPQCLEDVEEFGGLRDYFETFTLYRGKKSLDDEDDDASRIAGYFKVMWCNSDAVALRINDGDDGNDDDDGGGGG